MNRQTGSQFAFSALSSFFSSQSLSRPFLVEDTQHLRKSLPVSRTCNGPFFHPSLTTFNNVDGTLEKLWQNKLIVTLFEKSVLCCDSATRRNATKHMRWGMALFNLYVYARPQQWTLSKKDERKENDQSCQDQCVGADAASYARNSSWSSRFRVAFSSFEE
jgi:hypothetical protein